MEPPELKQAVSNTLSKPEDIFLTTSDKTLIDAEIHEYEVLSHHLTQRIAALKNHRNSLSPTSQLPMEVLSEVMLVASHQSIKENNESDVYPTSLPLPLILGHVCAAWRTLAWKLPGLWSTIPLALAKAQYEKQVVLLDEWLARAGEHQELYLVLTLRYDYAELQYWRDYPPRDILKRLYKRSKQWHTFYSTLPNLCFDLFAGVYEKLPRLNTLILNRSGRMAYEVFLGGFPGSINNLGAIGGNPFIHGGGGGGANGGAGIGGGAGGAGGGGFPLGGITIDVDNPKINPWHMLSCAPSLRTVVLPEALAPSEITLPYCQLTHLEVRTIPIDDCLRVLEQTPLIVSFDFYGIYSGPLTFLPTPHLHLAHLRKFSVFSDPANLSRFLDALTAPKLYGVDFKSTTGTLSLITSQLVQLIERSGCRLRKLGVCIPNVGKCEEQLVGFLGGAEMRGLEEIVLESWQVDVEGLSDAFLERMNPERRVRTVRKYSYPLPALEEQQQQNDGDGDAAMAVIVAPGWVDVPMDEVREVEDEVIEVGEEGVGDEVLLPNLVAMTYKGTLSFQPKTLRNLLLARWRRKARKRLVPKLHHNGHCPGALPPLSPLCTMPELTVGPIMENGLLVPLDADNDVDEATSADAEVVTYEEEEWFPTALLCAFEIYAPDADFKQAIDEETNMVFRELLREGFCLSITTKRGLLAF